MTERLLTTIELAQLLGVKKSTIEQWRFRAEGPPAIHLSRGCVRYSPSEVQRWIDQRRGAPTTSETAA